MILLFLLLLGESADSTAKPPIGLQTLGKQILCDFCPYTNSLSHSRWTHQDHSHQAASWDSTQEMLCLPTGTIGFLDYWDLALWDQGLGPAPKLPYSLISEAPMISFLLFPESCLTPPWNRKLCSRGHRGLCAHTRGTCGFKHTGIFLQEKEWKTCFLPKRLRQPYFQALQPLLDQCNFLAPFCPPHTFSETRLSQSINRTYYWRCTCTCWRILMWSRRDL